jgi:hypothetical protein
MGYDLHITRKSQWSDEKGPPISQVERQRFEERDPESSAYPDVGGEDRGKIASHHDNQGALWWDDDEVRAKNSDQSLVRKIVAIALNA